MPNLKALRQRIDSVGATRKITRAMQMVAASKLRRAQELVLASRPYAESIHKTLSALATQTEKGGLPLRLRRFFDDEREIKTHLFIVMTSQRGLCGGFNTQILRLVNEQAKTLKQQGKEVKFICVGKKALDVLQRQWAGHVLASFATEEDAYPVAETISEKIVALFKEEAFDACTLFFSHFYSVLNQEPRALKLIPIEKIKGITLNSVYSYEPEADEMLDGILPAHFTAQLLRGFLENGAGEQGARMTAMDNATRNAEDMIAALSLKYNRTRQAVITNELIEIISGAEAL